MNKAVKTYGYTFFLSFFLLIGIDYSLWAEDSFYPPLLDLETGSLEWEIQIVDGSYLKTKKVEKDFCAFFGMDLPDDSILSQASLLDSRFRHLQPTYMEWFNTYYQDLCKTKKGFYLMVHQRKDAKPSSPALIPGADSNSASHHLSWEAVVQLRHQWSSSYYVASKTLFYIGIPIAYEGYRWENDRLVLCNELLQSFYGNEGIYQVNQWIEVGSPSSSQAILPDYIVRFLIHSPSRTVPIFTSLNDIITYIRSKPNIPVAKPFLTGTPSSDPPFFLESVARADGFSPGSTIQVQHFITKKTRVCKGRIFWVRDQEGQIYTKLFEQQYPLSTIKKHIYYQRYFLPSAEWFPELHSYSEAIPYQVDTFMMDRLHQSIWYPKHILHSLGIPVSDCPNTLNDSWIKQVNCKRLDPNALATLWLELTNYYLQDIQEFDEAKQRDSGGSSPDLWQEQALILASQAIDHADAIAHIPPDLRFDIVLQKAIVFDQMENFTGGIAYLSPLRDELLGCDPSLPCFLFPYILGNCYYGLNRWDESIQSFQKALGILFNEFMQDLPDRISVHTVRYMVGILNNLSVLYLKKDDRVASLFCFLGMFGLLQKINAPSSSLVAPYQQQLTENYKRFFEDVLQLDNKAAEANPSKKSMVWLKIYEPIHGSFYSHHEPKQTILWEKEKHHNLLMETWLFKPNSLELMDEDNKKWIRLIPLLSQFPGFVLINSTSDVKREVKDIQPTLPTQRENYFKEALILAGFPQERIKLSQQLEQPISMHNIPKNQSNPPTYFFWIYRLDDLIYLLHTLIQKEV